MISVFELAKQKETWKVCPSCKQVMKGIYSYEARTSCSTCGGKGYRCSKTQLAERNNGKSYKEKILEGNKNV